MDNSIEDENMRSDAVAFRFPESREAVEKTKGKTKIDFFFAPHGEAEDINHFGEHLNQADVLVLECLHWTPQEEKIYNIFAQGQASLDRLPPDAHTAEILKKIHNTKKPVLLVDIPEGSPEEQQYMELNAEASDANSDATRSFFSGKFDDSIEKRKAQLNIRFQQKELREAYILKALQVRIDEYKAAHPEIKDPGNLKIMANYGRAHLPLYHKAQEAGFAAGKKMNSPVSILFTEDEIINRKFLGKEADDYLYARVPLENIIFPAVKKKHKITNEQAVWLTRKIVDGLTLEDFREVSQRMGPAFNNKDKYAELNKFLREKNVVIPSDEIEMEKIMGSDWSNFQKINPVLKE